MFSMGKYTMCSEGYKHTTWENKYGQIGLSHVQETGSIPD